MNWPDGRTGVGEEGEPGAVPGDVLRQVFLQLRLTNYENETVPNIGLTPYSKARVLIDPRRHARGLNGLTRIKFSDILPLMFSGGKKCSVTDLISSTCLRAASKTSKSLKRRMTTRL